MSIILGIDPWTTTTWFAIIKNEWNRREILNYWVIETIPKEELWIKLFQISQDLEELLNSYKVDCCAIEKLFFTKNVKTWIDVAHARWIMILALAKRWIPILEYTPLQVKQWICWNWSATKKQVQNALVFLFKLKEIPSPDDAADAIAIAYIWSLRKIWLLG
ncbi:MAG: hypothetical protein ACD_3C00188G0007 [uncultured bacterium (gcode 4)]|uniref:Crossover junction endodeoxyribonuclease RuvC n=1 Tax=uncultured bacterium (gcode 4) TaxID=1234023 RepID=K2F8Y6_9BACT|nr:MAG: hypothetical protein ACD_3C00188G0007 [uncultured bacterium (gcode 4)]